ncbi:MAG: hypothetical protein HZA93_09540 [Verrucomicrobia bacterium]|nr:hypothetical protein [Verrucomicrobiota bacterium]
MLITALLVAAIISVVLASYLNLNLSTTRLAKRTFDGYAALNLAEAGTEEGVWSFNRAVAGDGAAWSGWTNNGVAAWQTFANFQFTANTSGTVKVYVDAFNPAANVTPKVVAQAEVTAPGTLPVTKLVEVTLRRRSYFANGLVAKDRIVFSGSTASVDSWSSDPDHDISTAAIPYSTAVRNDRGSVASNAVGGGAVSVNQADIWGTVATGGTAPAIGHTGSIRGADTPPAVRVDPRRVATDFNADFPLVAAPGTGTTLTSVGATLGTANATTRWRANHLTLSGTQSLTILGQVSLVLTAGSGAPAIDVTGSATIDIPRGSSLALWVEGNVRIAGNGLGNANVQPVTCQIWGVNTTQVGQSFHLAGNGALKCVLYAPFGDVTINGNGDVMGSVVARTITLTGNAAFHYDEALRDHGTDTPFNISKWRELSTAADRARWTEIFRSF